MQMLNQSCGEMVEQLLPTTIIPTSVLKARAWNGPQPLLKKTQHNLIDAEV